MGTLLDEIKQLNIADRIELIESLSNCIANRSSNFSITDAQRAEFDRRLARRASEKPHSVTLTQITQKLGVNIGILWSSLNQTQN
ncbi:addiction module protein [Undibacterium flavidum]|uniref:Addiction module protein n=1 Tax=Undibacterium flavidum TaxID=2762297 RepID=A0ABR6YGF7_9BURK|nr:addiction module protein [Undibacterium flavidum]MBC3875569.1 addiction module protein [Undibacterium flavidum]